MSLGSFVRGFHSVVPRSCIRMLSPKLLEGMLCGQPIISDDDIGDLRAVVVVTNHDDQKDQAQLLTFFFETILDMEQSQRQKLLQFWCGSTVLVVWGACLEGVFGSMAFIRSDFLVLLSNGFIFTL